MAWATVSEVKEIIGFPTTGAPITDAVITSFISYAQNEVENIANTKFLYNESTGTATAGAATTLTETGKTWTVDQWNDYYAVYIYSGTGSGQMRTIVDNTATVLTVDTAWTTNPDTTSKYKIFQNTRITESVNGSANDTLYLSKHPLFNLRGLSIEDTTITTTSVYVTYISAKLVLSETSEVSVFTYTKPQQVDVDYYFGYHTTFNSLGIPLEVKELCITIAGLKTLYAQIASTYDTVATFSLPHISGSTGQPYVNINAAVTRLEDRKLELIKLIPKFRSL